MTVKEALDQILDRLPEGDQQELLEFAGFLRWRQEQATQRGKGLNEQKERPARAAQSEADDDIRAGRIKRFDNPDDMIASLKQPW